MNKSINLNPTLCIVALSIMLLFTKDTLHYSPEWLINTLASMLCAMVTGQIVLTCILNKKEQYSFISKLLTVNVNNMQNQFNKDAVINKIMHNFYQLAFGLLLFASFNWSVIPAMMVFLSGYCIIESAKLLKQANKTA